MSSSKEGTEGTNPYSVESLALATRERERERAMRAAASAERARETPIAETPTYISRVGTMSGETVKGQVGYLVINKRTGVTEFETNAEFNAIEMTHAATRLLEKRLMDPENRAGEQAASEAAQRFAGLLESGDVNLN